MECIKLAVLFAAPEPCKFVNFFLNFCLKLRCDFVKYAHGLVENLLNQHKERAILLVMCICSYELWDVDGLGYLDELLNALILGSDDREEVSAIAEAHGGMH